MFRRDNRDLARDRYGCRIGVTHRDRLRDPAAVGGWPAAIARN